MCHLLGSCSLLGLNQLSQTLPAVAVTTHSASGGLPLPLLLSHLQLWDVPRGQAGLPAVLAVDVAHRFTSAPLPPGLLRGGGHGEPGGADQELCNRALTHPSASPEHLGVGT